MGGYSGDNSLGRQGAGRAGGLGGQAGGRALGTFYHLPCTHCIPWGREAISGGKRSRILLGNICMHMAMSSPASFCLPSLPLSLSLSGKGTVGRDRQGYALYRDDRPSPFIPSLLLLGEPHLSVQWQAGILTAEGRKELRGRLSGDGDRRQVGQAVAVPRR